MAVKLGHHPGLYATDDGRVWLESRHIFLKNTQSNKYGHQRVAFRRNGVCVKLFVHRAVLMAFTGPCPSGLQCCHRNGIASDNRPDNLRWGSAADNARDRTLHGHSGRNGPKIAGEKNVFAKLTSAEVTEIRNEYAAGATAKSISRKYRVSPSQIGKIATRESWAHLPKGAIPSVSGHKRAARGEKHGNAKLTEQDVIAMRTAYSSGGRITIIAKRYGIGWRHALMIVKRKAWKHLP